MRMVQSCIAPSFAIPVSPLFVENCLDRQGSRPLSIVEQAVHAEPAHAWQSPRRRHCDKPDNFCHSFATQLS
jgi:hypothetical protein